MLLAVCASDVDSPMMVHGGPILSYFGNKGFLQNISCLPAPPLPGLKVRYGYCKPETLSNLVKVERLVNQMKAKSLAGYSKGKKKRKSTAAYTPKKRNLLISHT
jgi:hypothetical protein